MRRVLLVPTLALLGVVSVFVFVIYPRRSPVVLMYHSVTDEADTVEPVIREGLFRRQMEFLVTHDYEIVSVRDVVGRLGSGQPVPSGWVALTFDRAWDEFARSVYPVLERYRLKATLFVVVSDVGRAGNLTWDQLRSLSAGGLVEIGSHSLDHVPYDCRPPSRAITDEARAKALLEKNLGVRVVSHAYPYGAYSATAARALRELGYQGAVGTVYRLDEFPRRDVFNLRRVFVSRQAALPGMFRFMLSGYYVPTRALLLRLLNIKTPRDVPCS